jgi:1,4-dihydroxy-2-naphthoyl-CoA synthase
VRTGITEAVAERLTARITVDAREGARAFAEKRAPQWKGK